MLASSVAEMVSGWGLNGYHIYEGSWELDLNKFLSQEAEFRGFLLSTTPVALLSHSTTL